MYNNDRKRVFFDMPTMRDVLLREIFSCFHATRDACLSMQKTLTLGRA